MNLKKVIEEKYTNVNRFSISHGLKPNHVKYWCDEDWEDLTKKTKTRICMFLGTTLEEVNKEMLKNKLIEFRAFWYNKRTSPTYISDSEINEFLD